MNALYPPQNSSTARMAPLESGRQYARGNEIYYNIN